MGGTYGPVPADLGKQLLRIVGKHFGYAVPEGGNSVRITADLMVAVEPTELPFTVSDSDGPLARFLSVRDALEYAIKLRDDPGPHPIHPLTR